MEAEEEDGQTDICRVCRTEGSEAGSEAGALFYPCLCTGSIKYVHQDCLLQWLKYSKKEYCELCQHPYSFQPIYHPDMPKRLPVADLVGGLGWKVWRGLKAWFHYTVVAVAWLGIVPLTASRIYRSLFTGSVNSLLMLPLDLVSSENLLSDALYGALIIALSLSAFIALVWLREQILHAAPNLLNLPQPQAPADTPAPARPPAQADPPHPAAAAADRPDAPPTQEAPPGPAEHGPAAEPTEAGGQEAVEGPAALGAEAAAEEEAVDEDEAEEGEEGEAEAEEGGENGGGGDEWRAFEWERAADELTWERLLGLDGSLVFLEHVFWVISLNTLFVLVFAFSPYHVGQFLAMGLGLGTALRQSRFEGVLTALVGYAFLCAFLFAVHLLSRLLRLRKVHKASGMMYLVLKVFLLLLLEIGLFPLGCGWWLDVCSLGLFASSLRERASSFVAAPGTSMFVHWLVGVVYVFYFASFVLLLREVLRPGVLWFVRNLNDPEFNPIQEMIQEPVLWHVRRYLASLGLFTLTILVLVYLPIRTLGKLMPRLLPYNIALNAETPVSELSLELLLLQVVLPALLEQGQARTFLKALVVGWAEAVGSVLQLRDYLLPEVTGATEETVGRRAPAGPGPENLAEEHLALLEAAETGPQTEQAYAKPPLFALRMGALLGLLAASAFGLSLVAFSLPVSIGRHLMSFLNANGQGLRLPSSQLKLAALGLQNVSTEVAGIIGAATAAEAVAAVSAKKTHELYTVAAGLYCCWLGLKVWGVGAEWVGRGWAAVAEGVRRWSLLLGKVVLVGLGLLGLIPYLVGLSFQLVVLAPVRVGLEQSPLFYPWQDWALGVVHCKIICAALMMGPEWWMRRALERLYQEGLGGLEVGETYRELVGPVAGALGLGLAVPYALARTPELAFGMGAEEAALLQRHIYPSLLLLCAVGAFLVWQLRQFSSLLLRIRDEKYLVGQRLVNYSRPLPALPAPPLPSAQPAPT